MNAAKNASPQQVIDEIRKRQRIVVVTHVNPDPDAYGSLYAMATVLQQLGKDVCCVNESAPANHLDYFHGSFSVQNVFPNNDQGDWEMVIALDCGDERRVGDTLVKEFTSRDWVVVNIDHHISNDSFGDINYVVPDASSTCEILCDLFDAAKIIFSEDIAAMLLSGIMADTGSFRYSCTSEHTLMVATKLVSLGANPEAVGRNLWGRVPLSAVKLQSEAMLGTEFFADGKIGLVIVTDEMLQRHGATVEATESLTERVRDIDGVLIAASIREYDGIWKVSLRSQDGKIDVSQVAKTFGGGGHKAAAAFRWKKDCATLKRSLIEKLRELLEAE